MRVNQGSYATFIREANDPRMEGYIVQMRIVCPPALVQGFGVDPNNANGFDINQSITVGELLWAFSEDQQAIWRSEGYSLEGMVGGDGDWAKESLSFGFFMENSYLGVYRIWSRAWLVTKRSPILRSTMNKWTRGIAWSSRS